MEKPKKTEKRERMVRKLITLPPDLLRRVEEYAARRQGEEPGVSWDATTAIRVLVILGLGAEKGR